MAITEFNKADDHGIVERTVSPPHLRPEELGRVLEGAEIIDQWLAAVRAHAKSTADKGVEIPGWKLVDKRGRRVWANEEAATTTMKGLLREDAFAHKLHSPTQIEKVLKSHKLKKPAQWSELVTMSDPGTPWFRRPTLGLQWCLGV